MIGEAVGAMLGSGSVAVVVGDAFAEGNGSGDAADDVEPIAEHMIATDATTTQARSHLDVPTRNPLVRHDPQPTVTGEASS